MTDKVKIDFKVLDSNPEVTISIPIDFPVEGYVAEYEWLNARANIENPTTGQFLSAHMDLNGDGKITKLEYRQIASAAKVLAVQMALPLIFKDTRTLSAISSESSAFEPRPDDADILMDRKAVFEKYKQVAEAKDIPVSLGKTEAERVKFIESAIDKTLGESIFGKSYNPDGKLTNGELEYFKTTSAANLPRTQATESKNISK